jgi:hypothetical protein
MSKTFFEGEQVSFLNQKGGGVVTKVTKDQIWVKDETGFEIPFPPGELIKIRQPNGLFMESQSSDSDAGKQYPTHKEVWLIWEPHSSENYTSGTLRVGNASPFDISVVLEGKFQGKFKRIWSGFIPLGQVSEALVWREDDVEWLRQFLVLCIPSLVVPHSFPGVVSLHLNTPKTFASHSKEELFLHPFSPKPGWVVNFNLSQEASKEVSISLSTIGNGPKKPANVLLPPTASKRRIDLHANALWKVPPPPKEILPAQLNALHSEIAYCIQHQVERLTIIHGIGEGKLKAAVLKELTHYKDLKIEEAHEADYGYGAITVFFLI